ncbi:MAG: rhodanese-like domain-containing protein [Gammaproteobacteria bacterium]|jgi:rhodanese-related sulfurtransferase
MKYPTRVFSLAVFLIFIFITTPAMSYDWVAPEIVDGATPVTAEELSDLMEQMDGLVLIDSRHDGQRTQGAIAGSVALPDTRTTPGALLRVVPNKLTPVVFYCEGITCPHSMKAVKKAVSYGYLNIFWFRGGLSEWTEKGFPVVQ